MSEQMMKVVLSGHIEIPAEELDIVESALVEHIRLTREEEGCLIFNVTKHASNPLRYNVYEEFKSELAFELHQKRVKSSAWGNVTGNVVRHYTVDKVLLNGAESL